MYVETRPLVLQLTKAGHPQAWLTLEQAAHAIAGDRISWSFGQVAGVLRGGINRTGVQSRIEVPSIISVRSGGGELAKVSFSRKNLFARDRHVCLYCGETFPESKLTVDHVKPRSAGGCNAWTNVVSSCENCNQRKANRTPEQAGMPLLAVPYAPNRYEYLYLRNRRILADQQAFLSHGFRNLEI